MPSSFSEGGISSEEGAPAGASPLSGSTAAPEELAIGSAWDGAGDAGSVDGYASGAAGAGDSAEMVARALGNKSGRDTVSSLSREKVGSTSFKASFIS